MEKSGAGGALANTVNKTVNTFLTSRSAFPQQVSGKCVIRPEPTQERMAGRIRRNDDAVRETGKARTRGQIVAQRFTARA